MNSSNDPNPIPDPDPLEAALLAQRVRALEEALAFAAHEADQMREHYLEMMRALETLERKVKRLEAEKREAEQEDAG